MTPWKQGDEFAPYHPDASHVAPEYRDGWNACYAAAMRAMHEERQRLIAQRPVIVTGTAVQWYGTQGSTP